MTMGNVVDLSLLSRRIDEIARIQSRIPLKFRGGNDNFGGMEARLAKLEATVEHIQRDTADIKSELRSLRDLEWSNFKIVFGSLIASSVGIAGLMAKGFHWF